VRRRLLTPPSASRLARPVARLTLAIGLVVFGSLAAALSTAGTFAGVAAAASCPSDSECVAVTANPYGNGTGELFTTDATFSTKDGAIDCSRSGGVTFGTCFHSYVSKHGQTITIHVRYVAAAGSEVCVGVPPLSAVQCGGSSATASFTFSASGSFSLDDHGFQLLDPGTLTVNRSGGGSGRVTSDPIGIDCGSACSVQFPVGSAVELTATAADGSTFQHWNGACAGTDPVCTVDITRKTSVSAVFALIPAPPPTPSPSPTPAPTAAGAAPTPTPAPTGSGGSGGSGGGGTPGPTQPDTGGPGASLGPDQSGLPTDTAGPGSTSSAGDSPGAAAVGSGAPSPAATSAPLFAGVGSIDPGTVIAIAAILSAIVISVGIAAFAISDRRARDQRARDQRNPPGA